MIQRALAPEKRKPKTPLCSSIIKLRPLLCVPTLITPTKITDLSLSYYQHKLVYITEVLLLQRPLNPASKIQNSNNAKEK